MSRIDWKTKPSSERSLHLRKICDRLSLSSRSGKYKAVESLAKIACNDCPFRGKECKLSPYNKIPFAHLTMILLRQNDSNFPNARHCFRTNLDNPEIDPDEYTCEELMTPIGGGYKSSVVESDSAELIPVPTKVFTYIFDFPMGIQSNYPPTSAEIKSAEDSYFARSR